MAKPIVYLISGLAADERVLKNLRLEAETRFLPWLPPLHQTEPFKAYAERMAAAIEPDRPGIIAGVSFGGMVALEIAATRPWLQAVELSSVNSVEQMPWHLRLIARTRVYYLTPPQVLKLFPWAGALFFGTKGKAEYTLFTQILEGADPAYMQWAIPQLMQWQPPANNSCVQIIGTEDRIFPADKQPDAIKIEGGTHLMTFSEAEKISQILNELVRELERN